MFKIYKANNNVKFYDDRLEADQYNGPVTSEWVIESDCVGAFLALTDDESIRGDKYLAPTAEPVRVEDITEVTVVNSLDVVTKLSRDQNGKFQHGEVVAFGCTSQMFWEQYYSELPYDSSSLIERVAAKIQNYFFYDTDLWYFVGHVTEEIYTVVDNTVFIIADDGDQYLVECASSDGLDLKYYIEPDGETRYGCFDAEVLAGTDYTNDNEKLDTPEKFLKRFSKLSYSNFRDKLEWYFTEEEFMTISELRETLQSA